MLFNWTAIAETEEGEAEFGATVEAEPAGADYRPVFRAARELAAEQAERGGYPPDSVTVTAISWKE